MAEILQPCCERARAHYLTRVAGGVASYPVIKDIPCPTCRRIIKIRVYARPDAVRESEPTKLGQP
jgi:hypothetical protein